MLRAERPEFYTREGQVIFLYSTASRLALEPTYPPIQWVPVVLYSGVKRPGCEADHSPPSCVEVKNGGAVSALPIDLPVVAFN
jgi:hypothetical protein